MLLTLINAILCQGLWLNVGYATFILYSKNQSTVELSTCEPKYYAIYLSSEETVLVRLVIKEAGF